MLQKSVQTLLDTLENMICFSQHLACKTSFSASTALSLLFSLSFSCSIEPWNWKQRQTWDIILCDQKANFMASRGDDYQTAHWSPSQRDVTSRFLGFVKQKVDFRRLRSYACRAVSWSFSRFNQTLWFQHLELQRAKEGSLKLGMGFKREIGPLCVNQSSINYHCQYK